MAKRFIFILLPCMFFISVVYANDSVSSTKNIKKDSIVAMPKNITLNDNKDSIKTIRKKSNFKPNPHTAALLSTFIPGGGQIYNRKYWKVPIVYAGYAALIYAINWNNKEYKEYKKAYISIADNDETTNYFTKYIPIGQESSYDKTWLTNVLNTKQMNYRNNRDLSIIGIVAFYGLTVLDAFVDAELFDFDVSPNLSFHFDPVFNISNSSIICNNIINKPLVGIQCNLIF